MRGRCAECGRVNRTSPSDYFCSDTCQQRWHTKRTSGYLPIAEIPVPAHLVGVVRRWRAA